MKGTQLLERVIKLDIINQLEKSYKKMHYHLFSWRYGKVHLKVVEGNRERTQVFEGVVIKRKGGG